MPHSGPSDIAAVTGDADLFAALVTALSASARGRWFLNEYARRTRSDEIGRLLDAVGQLERMAAEAPASAVTRAVPEPAASTAAIHPASEGPIAALTDEIRALTAAVQDATRAQNAGTERLDALSAALQHLTASPARRHIQDTAAPVPHEPRIFSDDSPVAVSAEPTVSTHDAEMLAGDAAQPANSSRPDADAAADTEHTLEIENDLFTATPLAGTAAFDISFPRAAGRARHADALAPIMALSDIERLALFS